MSNKVKMHPELSPENNQNSNAANEQQEQKVEVKQKWSEKHPKIAGFFKSLPKMALSAGKKILGGIIVIGGGIILGVVGLEVAKPKRYGEFPLQLPETKHPALPVIDVEVKPIETVPVQEVTEMPVAAEAHVTDI